MLNLHNLRLRIIKKEAMGRKVFHSDDFDDFLGHDWGYNAGGGIEFQGPVPAFFEFFDVLGEERRFFESACVLRETLLFHQKLSQNINGSLLVTRSLLDLGSDAQKKDFVSPGDFSFLPGEAVFGVEELV